MPDQAAVSAALGADDYKALYGMLTSADDNTRTQGQALAKKLTPGEQQDFFSFQRQYTVGKGELGRPDATIGGMPPELAVTGGLGIGRALMTNGTSLAGKAVAGAKALVTEAAPVIKYKLAKAGLEAVGVPPEAADGLAMLAAGLPNGKRMPPRARTAAPKVSAPMAAVPAAAETAAAETAAVAPPPAAPAVAPSASAPGPMGSAADLVQVQGEFHRLVAAGKSKEEALALIEQQLKLQQQLGLPSLDAVRRAVLDRNAKGRWPTGGE